MERAKPGYRITSKLFFWKVAFHVAVRLGRPAGSFSAAGHSAIVMPLGIQQTKLAAALKQTGLTADQLGSSPEADWAQLYHSRRFVKCQAQPRCWAACIVENA